MARFTSTRRVKFTFGDTSFSGPAGTEFEIPDAQADALEAYARGNIRGFRWVRESDGEWLDARITALEMGSGPGGDHPNLATHETLGLASAAAVTAVADALTAHEAGLDVHPNYALDADLSDHEAEGHVHEHDAAYSAVGHNHDGSYAAPHAHPYASDTHNHDASYAAVSHGSHLELGTGAGEAAEGDHTHPGGGGEAFPVGSVFIAVVSTDPATLLGYGTWEAFGAGRVLVGRDSGDADFDTAEETGGAKTKAISAHAGAAVGDHASHTHTYDDVISHTHVQSVPSATNGGLSGMTPDTSTNNSVASGYSTQAPAGAVAQGTTDGPSATLSHSVTQPSAHSDLNVVQPYIVVYMWKRTA